MQVLQQVVKLPVVKVDREKFLVEKFSKELDRKDIPTLIEPVSYTHLDVYKRQGQVFIDPTGKANGRGAYIKLDNAEALEAKKKKVFNRSFNMEVEESFYDELIAYVDHKVKRRELGLE